LIRCALTCQSQCIAHPTDPESVDGTHQWNHGKVGNAWHRNA